MRCSESRTTPFLQADCSEEHEAQNYVGDVRTKAVELLRLVAQHQVCAMGRYTFKFELCCG